MVTDEQTVQFIENSTERHIAQDFPEYIQFLTGIVEPRVARIINVIGEPRINVFEEAKRGDLGDLIDVYMALKLEEQFEKTFWGRLRRMFYFRRMPWDRAYVQEKLKKALNNISVQW